MGVSLQSGVRIIFELLHHIISELGAKVRARGEIPQSY